MASQYLSSENSLCSCNNHKQLSQPPSSIAEETTGQAQSFVFCFSDEALFEMNCGILLVINDELVTDEIQPICQILQHRVE